MKNNILLIFKKRVLAYLKSNKKVKVEKAKNKVN